MGMRARRTLPGSVAIVALGLSGALVFSPGVAFQAEAVGSRLVAPLELGLSRVTASVGHLFGTVQHAGDLAAQNETYRDEIDRLQAAVVQMRELEVENHDLRELLGLRERAGLGSLLSVDVIARDPLGPVQAVTIDRGSGDGVQANMPVITWKGLIGRVVEVQPTSAKVLLITDVNSAVSVRIQDPASRATGVVRGVGDGRLLLQYVPRTDLLRTDDIAITSGIGGIFPPGVLVGRVLQVRQRDVEVFQEALVEPAADMRNLERLYVLLQQQTPAPPATQPPPPGQAPPPTQPG
jgi:rod shape-determining protein MreC